MSGYQPITTGLGTHSSVNSIATSATLLAANIQRKGATLFNTDANALCVNLAGGTATITTAFHVRLTQNQYYEVPFGYTGDVTGIWEVDGSGACNVCEFT